MSEQAHVVSVRLNLTIYGILLGLLVLTVGLAYVDLGRLNFPVAISIAVTKAVLILLYFMHVRWSPKLTWAFAAAAFAWLGILIIFTLGDYLSRGWLDIAGK